MEKILCHPDTYNILSKKILNPILGNDEKKVTEILDAFFPDSAKDLSNPIKSSVINKLEDQTRILANLPKAIMDYYRAYSPKEELTPHQINMIMCAASQGNAITWCNLPEIEADLRDLFEMLWPYEVEGASKVRIGGERDGGYIGLDPGRGGIAYSLGVSDYSPWDLEMAERGFKVFQFDGTIKKAPNSHPNLVFINKNVVAKNPANANEIKFDYILEHCKAENIDNRILQIDIEGGEFEIFEQLESEHLKSFSQIIGEFHRLHNPVNVKRAKKIVAKLLKTHVPVHFHYNNYSKLYGFKNFLLSHLFEITFVKRSPEKCYRSGQIYPTPLDRPNKPGKPDFYIGKFEDITARI